MRNPLPTAYLPYFNGSARACQYRKRATILDELFGLLDLDHAFGSRGPDLLDPLSHTPGKGE